MIEQVNLPERAATEQIRARTAVVLERIAAAARKVGRDPGSILLVVVTKGQPLDVVRAAIAAGLHTFGENYADQAVPKIQALQGEGDLGWHMIGHVQSRKARLVGQYFNYVHSLDRLKLAQRLDRFAGESGRRLPVLLQYNVSGEATKSGWPAYREGSWESLLSDVEAILGMPHLEIRGLMTMAPFLEDPQAARPYFQRLIRLRDYLASQFREVSWSEVSMGMSADYPVAVEEGATMVRIGEAILGPRPG